jgi:pyridoxal phosphate enzyme (YggS family)
MAFPWLAERVAEVSQRIAAARDRGGHRQTVSIVAVTKSHGPASVEAAWAVGLRQVGENRVQEAIVKMDAVVAPVEWHLIGHLQRNKVRFLDRFVLFHALDSERLAEAVDAHGRSREKPVPVLVQVNVSGEGSKGGFAPAELGAAAERLRRAGGLMVRGAMTMAPLDADEVTLRRTFAGCREALGVLREAGHQASELSMGMSNDYEVAVEEGATMVRLGTILFGERVT